MRHLFLDHTKAGRRGRGGGGGPPSATRWDLMLNREGMRVGALKSKLKDIALDSDFSISFDI